jgi:hypothetical protein
LGECEDRAVAAAPERLAGLAWAAVAVAFEQRVIVMVGSELAEAGAQMAEGVEALLQRTCSLSVWMNVSTTPLFSGSSAKAGERSMPRWSISAW